MSSAPSRRQRIVIDLGPAASRMVHLLDGVDESQLTLPTPCPDMSVGDLIDHIGTFAAAFTTKADKSQDNTPGPPTRPNAANLEREWRDRIVRDLGALAAAWTRPSAWEGTTTAGGMELSASVAGVVALDELVVHGWDLAVSTRQPYGATDAEIAAATELIAAFPAPRDGRLFGPVVSIADDAPSLDRLIGLAGRDPSWRPSN
jgi:uncharacterized protein (TIGR03086 family)